MIRLMAGAYEMTLSRADFLRILPGAVGSSAVLEEDGCFRPSGLDPAWTIRLTALPPLRLGLLSLERHRVELDFQGSGAEAFLDRFWLHFRRGGG
jgi:hypothetical protein